MSSITILGGDSGSGREVRLIYYKSLGLSIFASGTGDCCIRSSLYKESSSSSWISSVFILGKWCTEFASELLWGVGLGSSLTSGLVGWTYSSISISLTFHFKFCSIDFSDSISSLTRLWSDLTKLLSLWGIWIWWLMLGLRLVLCFEFTSSGVGDLRWLKFYSSLNEDSSFMTGFMTSLSWYVFIHCPGLYSKGTAA